MSWRRIEFDELPIKVAGRNVGMFDGEADITRNGNVMSIWLNTDDKQWVHLHSSVESEQDQDLFANLAASLRENYACSILDAMTDMALNDSPAVDYAEMDMDIRRAS